MIPTKLEISVDKELVKEEIKRQVDSAIIAQLWLVDLEKIAELTCMSKRFLEDEIINDSRMRVIEIRKTRKRWWIAKQAFEVIQEITNEW